MYSLNTCQATEDTRIRNQRVKNSESYFVYSRRRFGYRQPLWTRQHKPRRWPLSSAGGVSRWAQMTLILVTETGKAYELYSRLCTRLRGSRAKISRANFC